VADNLLAIFTVVYEVLSAAFTTLRSYQALRVGATGELQTQKKGLTYLVLEQGIRVATTQGKKKILTGTRTSIFFVSFLNLTFSFRH